jgi:hypothetical protein
MELVQTKRDYHIVAFRSNTSFFSSLFLENWKFGNRKVEFIDKISVKGNFINHLRIESNKQYFSGDGEIDFYLDKNSQPPYIYDILLFEYPKTGIIVLCMPFKKLAVDIIDSLIKEYNILVTASFLKTDLSKLVASNNKYTDLTLDSNHFTLRGIILKNKDATSTLSSLQLIGKKPIESPIYKNYLQQFISNETFGIKKVTVQCLSQKSKSSMLIDYLGNYKFFINEKGNNIKCIDSIFHLLNHLDCLLDTSKNPITPITLIEND